jgi:hypothetical protein
MRCGQVLLSIKTADDQSTDLHTLMGIRVCTYSSVVWLVVVGTNKQSGPFQGRSRSLWRDGGGRAGGGTGPVRPRGRGTSINRLRQGKAKDVWSSLRLNCNNNITRRSTLSAGDSGNTTPKLSVLSL